MTTEGMSEEEKNAVKKAMDLLLHKDRTESELAERLYKAGYSEKASEVAMAYVKSYGYINDERYARTFVEYHKGKRSKRELKFKLEQKGVSKEIIACAIEAYEGNEEEEALRGQLFKRLKGRALMELSYEEEQKIIAYLARKGYTIPTIKRVLQREKESCS